jgi:hypothetical protein
MVFVLRRTPAFQLFGPFQDRSQALDDENKAGGRFAIVAIDVCVSIRNRACGPPTAYTYREFLLQCGCQHSAR